MNQERQLKPLGHLKDIVNDAEILLIQTFLVGNQLVTDFLVNSDLFNNFYCNQCTAVVNGSFIPTNLTVKANIGSLHLNSKYAILSKSLDPNRTPGDDEVFPCAIKLCASSTSKPLHIIFKNFLENESFSKEWKKARCFYL